MKKDFKQEILDKIKKEKIKPISKQFFSWKNRLLWFLVFLIIVLLWITFSFFYNDLQDLKEVWCLNYENRLFLIPNIFWFVLIVVLLISWIFYYRKTKYWYKQDNFIIISTLVIITIFVWNIFIFSNYSRLIHKNMIENSSILKDYVYRENLWNDSSNWRLIWIIKEINIDDIRLEGIDSKIWKIDIKNSIIWKNITLKIGEKIRIIWNLKSEDNFEATKIMPYFWMWSWKSFWKWKSCN